MTLRHLPPQGCFCVGQHLGMGPPDPMDGQPAADGPLRGKHMGGERLERLGHVQTLESRMPRSWHLATPRTPWGVVSVGVGVQGETAFGGQFWDPQGEFLRQK